MSRKEPTLMERAEMEVRCGFCNAGSREWCTTGSDKPATYLHDARTDQVLLIYRLGLVAGLEQAAHALDTKKPAASKVVIERDAKWLRHDVLTTIEERGA